MSVNHHSKKIQFLIALTIVLGAIMAAVWLTQPGLLMRTPARPKSSLDLALKKTAQQNPNTIPDECLLMALPRLARLPDISGTVIAHFKVGSTGKVENLRLEGHPILSKEVEHFLNRASFSDTCKFQALTITYRFQLPADPYDALKDSISFSPPATYTIMSNSTSVDSPACSSVRRSGRKVVSSVGGEELEFYVPYSAHVRAGGDVDYNTYAVRYGNTRAAKWLVFMFGLLVGGSGSLPNDVGNPSIKWTKQRRICCGDEVATDWRGVGADGRKWRHIGITGGSARYEDVSPEAAEYFDKILDSMCCRKCFDFGR